MASINQQTNGRRLIQFINRDKIRKTIRLGKVSQRIAEAVKLRVEHLVTCSITGHTVDDETARWLASLDDGLISKLAVVGLVEGRECTTLLKVFTDQYIQSRRDTRESTRTVYSHTQRNLIEYFGANKILRDITPGDADEWRLYLVSAGLADNTVRRRCGLAKQFFNAALRKRLIQINPFTDLKAAVRANTKRMYFISREEAECVIDACPDAQWRLLFALSRYGGLRCPSEHLALKWEDIDWDKKRITIHSPKTEHHHNCGTRQLPLFPELLPHLQQVFDEAESGTEYVITRYRHNNVNLRTHLYRIIKAAGLTPWPKLFQNLRSTRETELAEIYPLHVVCAWIGNSQLVAAKHYLQVTEDHFDQAADDKHILGDQNEIKDNTANKKALQKALQHLQESPRSTQHRELPKSGKPLDCNKIPDSAATRRNVKISRMGATGLEPVTSAV